MQKQIRVLCGIILSDFQTFVFSLTVYVLLKVGGEVLDTECRMRDKASLLKLHSTPQIWLFKHLWRK